ncbi:MAG: hypothetical protein M3516_00690 [Actinomycetota bacterium]|nr:hypothetical protein [Actinomycetota bacterium]
MIELEMVRRMIRRGLLFAPLVIGILWAAGGPRYAVSGAAGIALTLANLWLAGRIIGGLAENRPDLLVIGAIVALGAGMGLVVVGLLVLRSIEYIELTVAGIVLIGSHLVVVVWEAAGAFLKIDPEKKQSLATVPKTRS